MRRMGVFMMRWFECCVCVWFTVGDVLRVRHSLRNVLDSEFCRWLARSVYAVYTFAWECNWGIAV